MVQAVELTNNLGRFHVELEQACARDIWGMTYRDLEDGVQSGRFLAVAVRGHAIAIFELLRTRAGPAMSCVALGGKYLDQWFPQLLEFADQLAKDQGCREIVAYGRPGWEPVLRRAGYERRAVVMTRAVQ